MKKSTAKVLLAHSSNDLYGASKILINIVELLLSEGYIVYLFLPEKGPLLENNIIKKCNVEIVEFGVFRKRYFNFLGLINRLYYIIKSTFIIRSFILKNKIDLVYTNTSTVVSPTFAAYLSKVPSISPLREIPFGSILYTKFLTNIFNLFSEKIIAVSNSTRDFWIKKGVVRNKIMVINNGFNFDFSSTKKTFKIIYSY